MKVRAVLGSASRGSGLCRQQRGEFTGLLGEDRMVGGDLDGVNAQTRRHFALLRGRYDLVHRAEHVGAGYVGK